MPFLEKLENLQNKPKQARIKILIISVVVIMMLIVVLWQTSSKYSPEDLETYQIPNPFNLLWENIKNLNIIFK